jgi:PREDICTED: hypothetical protein
MDSGMQNNQPKTPASSTVDAAMKAPHPGGGSDFGLNPEDAVSKVADKIQHATNILIALSKDPNVDEISAAIALAFVLDQQKKHVTAIYSGQTPNALEFLRPEETFQKDISGLQDFIIALNKSKADHLIYQVEGDYVKILITPYKGQIKKEDLEYSYSDYNVDLVIVFNVNSGSEIDSALSEYGRIMHDAMAINITSSVPGRFADLEWSDPSKSSVCEMVYDLLSELEIDNTPQEVATALLTGILSATERFSNNRTKPTTMAVASKLMEAGADQQLISSNILKAETPAVAAENPFATQSSSTIEAPVTPVAQEAQEAPATPTIQETPETSAGPVAPMSQETPVTPVAQESPAATAATPEVSAASQDSTKTSQLTPEQELERMFEQNQASQSQAPASGNSLPGNPMVAASNVMDDLARLTDSMLSAESPVVPNVAPVAPAAPVTPVESITPNIPAVPENIPAAPEAPVVTPTIPVAPENIPVAPENSPAPNISVAPETPTIPVAPVQPQYIQPQPMQYQPAQPQPVQYQSVQPQPQQYQPVQPQPEQIQPMPQMQAEYQPTPQFVQPATQPIQPAPQPAQPAFRPQPASNPEIYGHTIAEPVIDSGVDMSRLMDEALAEPSPIQNPIGYQGMINQSNYINQSLNQNTTPNYPLAVGQQPVTNYQQGQNLATLSAPALPQMPQNQAYPNPEYSNVVPEYQTPAMPVLPEDPSQPAPQPVQPVPQPIPQPAPQPIQSAQPQLQTPVQSIPESTQPQMQVPIQPVPEPIQPQQPMDSYIQTTPPTTSTPIPDFLQPESFLPPAPAPVIIDQSAPPFMPPAMPAPQAIPQPTPQPAPQPTTSPVQPVLAPATSQPQMQTQSTPQPVQPQTQPTQAPAVNPVKADPSAFHIPGSY